MKLPLTPPGRLARFEAPKQVTFLDDLPKGGTGKVSKPALRERR